MAKVKKIVVEVHTGADGTNGRVYLGLGGREFRLDTDRNDFQPYAKDSYILGVYANILNAAENDPRSPYEVTTEMVSYFQRYIRFEPSDAKGVGTWTLAGIKVNVTPEVGDVITYAALIGAGQYMRFGKAYSERLYFGAPI